MTFSPPIPRMQAAATPGAPGDLAFSRLFSALDRALKSGATLNTFPNVHDDCTKNSLALPPAPELHAHYDDYVHGEGCTRGGGGGSGMAIDTRTDAASRRADSVVATWVTCSPGPSRSEAQLFLHTDSLRNKFLDVHAKSSGDESVERGAPVALAAAATRIGVGDGDKAGTPAASTSTAYTHEGGGGGEGEAAVPTLADLHTRWAARLERDEAAHHFRRMQNVHASIARVQREATSFETHVQSALADAAAEDATLTTAVTEHVAAAVTRVEALAWECRVEFDRAAAVLDHRATRSSREHCSIRDGIEVGTFDGAIIDISSILSVLYVA